MSARRPLNPTLAELKHNYRGYARWVTVVESVAGVPGNALGTTIDATASLIPGAAAGSASVTWNPLDKTASLTLSNGNLTATAASSAQSVNATLGRSTGKWVFAFDPTVINGTVGFLTGVRTSAAGTARNGIQHAAFGSITRFVAGAGTSLTAADNYNASASEVMIGVDLDALLFWVRVGSGNWNNSGTANPATGAEGRDFSACGAGSYLPYFQADNATSELIANFGASAFTNALPSGFSSWDGSQTG